MRNTMPLHDRRRIRANQMTALIMQELSQFYEGDQHREIRDALYKLLWRSGVEIITDIDRRNAGLPDRNNEGWTDDELRILEARRLELMFKPIDYKFDEIANITK